MAVSCSPLVSFITCGSTSHGLARRAHATPPFSCLPSRKVNAFHGNTCYESCSLSDSLEQPHNRKLRFREVRGRSLRINCSAASFSGGDQAAESDENPYKVLGVNPFETFDKIKAVYAKRQKDAEKRGDEAALTRIEKAYDKIMMAQLANRKQGLTFGSFEVSKDIKYADRQPIVPWGPRYAPSSKRDILINLAISAVFGLWIICTQSADWKPFQFLIFGYMWRVFDKLKDFEKAEPSVSSEEEDEGRRTKGGKRLLRTLGLVFSCVAVCSLAYTGLLNGIEFVGQYIPRYLINGQELIVTLATAVSLFFMGSYYR